MDIRGLCEKISRKTKLFRIMREGCHLISAITVAAFALGFRFYLNISPALGIKYLAVLGIPFCLVSLLRKYIGAPRPYEIYDFYEKKPKGSEKNSFPSRHAFSVFAIGTLLLFAYPVFGIVLLLLGVALCVCRVLLGYHFIRDVLAGALIGVISSLIGSIFLR